MANSQNQNSGTSKPKRPQTADPSRPDTSRGSSSQAQRGERGSQRQDQSKDKREDIDREESDKVEIGDPVPETDRTIKASRTTEYRGETGEDEDLPGSDTNVEHSSSERH